MSLIGSLGSGISAMQTFAKGLEVIGNNIANVNTTGYKTSNAEYGDSFSDLLKSSTPAPASGNGSDTPSLQVGMGVKLASVDTNFSQGDISSTGIATNLAISGNGFFVVKDPVSGEQFATRDGSFRWDSNGYMVTAQGYRVQGLTGGTSGSAPATVGSIKEGTPPAGTELKSASIDSQGNIVESYSDGSSVTTNQVLMQNYNDPSALMKQGGNLYAGLKAAGPVGGGNGDSSDWSTDASSFAPDHNGLGSIQSAALEGSNVDLTAEFGNMITAQRSFQAGSRLVTVSDTMLDDVVNLKRS